jgi:spore coat protein B
MEQTGVSLVDLQSMVGKGIRVFKGGPESKTGRLLAVNSDHLVLQTENEGVIYYCLEHLKSVGENSKEHFSSNNLQTATFFETENMNELMLNLKGLYVQIDRGGPEARKGTLLDVKPDHFILQTNEDGVLYSTIRHIKSVSLAIQNNQQENAEGAAAAAAAVAAVQNANGVVIQGANGAVVQSVPDYLDFEDFNTLLQNMKHSWVQINRGGPEKIEGIICETADDHIILINGQEINRVQTYHIRNVSYPKQQENQNQNQQNQNQNQQQESETFSKFMQYAKYKDYANSKDDKKYNKYLKYKKYESKVSSKFEDQQQQQQDSSKK